MFRGLQLAKKVILAPVNGHFLWKQGSWVLWPTKGEHMAYILYSMRRAHIKPHAPHTTGAVVSLFHLTPRNISEPLKAALGSIGSVSKLKRFRQCLAGSTAVEIPQSPKAAPRDARGPPSLLAPGPAARDRYAVVWTIKIYCMAFWQSVSQVDRIPTKWHFLHSTLPS